MISMPQTLVDDPEHWEARIDAAIERYQRYVNPGLANLMKFGGFGSLEASADGSIIRDALGREYIDCLGGYGVFSLGHRHPKVIEAVKDQLERLPLSTRTFFSEPHSLLAERLAEVAPGDLQYSFFCHSGTEAVEGALKLARAASGKPGVITAKAGFHGKTMGSLSACGREVFRAPFEPLLGPTPQVPYGDAEALEAAITPDIGAVILEPIQGEGGVIVPPDGYLRAVREICDRRDLLFIADEVQTGFGRTGKMFGVEWEGVGPDIMCLAKALGGGVEAMGAFMGTPETWEKLFGENPMMHTTSVASLLGARAGLVTLDVIQEERLPERAEELGAWALGRLKEIQAAHPKSIAEVRGKGLLLGIEMTHKDISLLVIGTLAMKGVVVAYAFNNPQVMRIEPALNIPRELLESALNRLDEALTESEEMLEGIAELGG
jgi:putrescine aminotransferase